jgi:uncharacterized membrane-anchored protein YhcB (DUF1043 family)
MIDDWNDSEFEDDGTADITDEESPLLSAEELASRFRRLAELRTARDRAKIAADKAKNAFDRYQAELLDEYNRSPLKGSVTIDIGGDFGTVQSTPVKTHYARILDRDAAEKYFRERRQTDEYVKEDFRMGRLHELIREHIEQKKPLPPGIDFYTKEYFRLTFKD